MLRGQWGQGSSWTGLWAIWSNERCPKPWQGCCTRWSLKVHPVTNHPIILWFSFTKQAIVIQLGIPFSRWHDAPFVFSNRNPSSSETTETSPRPLSVWPLLTFIAVPHCAKVNIVLVIGEEQETEPWVKGINGHNEEDPNNVALFIWAAIAAEMHVDLRDGEGRPGSVVYGAERRK